MPLTIKLTYNKARIKPSGETRVYLRITLNRQTKPLKLDFYWPAQKINLAKGILLPRTTDDPDVENRNLQIKNKINDITEVEIQYSLKRRILTIDMLLKDLGFFKLRMTLEKWMKFKVNERFNTGEIQKGTMKNHCSTIDAISQFQAGVHIDEINKAWLTKYYAWHRKRGNGHNLTWNRIKDVKSYLALAEKEAMLVIDSDFRNYANTPSRTETTFLNMRELNLMFDLSNQVSLSQTQQNVLNAFLFQCTTSLRISDVYRANSEWNIEPDCLRFIPKKGARRRLKRLVVPIMPAAKPFIENLKGKFFNLPSEVEYNRTLKEIAAMAGIYKSISSHVGRHTFGHIFCKYIGNMKALQLIMGHSSINTTNRYAHLENEDLFDAVMKLQTEINIHTLKKA